MLKIAKEGTKESWKLNENGHKKLMPLSRKALKWKKTSGRRLGMTWIMTSIRVFDTREVLSETDILTK